MFIWDFENKTTHNGIHFSRYIASWHNSGGRVYGRDSIFGMWLKLVGCTEDEVKDICDMATNGKLELEDSARKFLENKIQGD